MFYGQFPHLTIKTMVYFFMASSTSMKVSVLVDAYESLTFMYEINPLIVTTIFI